MSRIHTCTVVFVFVVAALAFGQVAPGEVPVNAPSVAVPSAPEVPEVDSSANVSLPRMAPELAFQTFQRKSAAQPEKLAAYSDTTIVEAELPDSAQKGEYELIRSFTAPNSLSFATVKFTGDNFVKTNVIVRLLQQEVDHAQKSDPEKTAITDANYKFSYKGTDKIDGVLCHVFQLKPRRKSPELFKGKIYLDAYTGSIHRAEGTLIKSPSFFVKNIDFVQDFADLSGFTVPVRLRSTAKARIIGRAVVNILHRGYKLEATSAAAGNSAAESVVGFTH